MGLIYFSAIQLSAEEEPLRGLLGRVLRRRILTSEISNQKQIPEARIIADWLVRLWFQVNEIIAKYNEGKFKNNSEGLLARGLLSGHSTYSTSKSSSSCESSSLLSQKNFIVSPALLMDCPVGDLAESQRWFLRTWNDKIAPELRTIVHTRRPSNPSLSSSVSSSYGGGNFHTKSGDSDSLGAEAADPINWIMSTYPWPASSECGAQHLTRLVPVFTNDYYRCTFLRTYLKKAICFKFCTLV